MLDLVSPRVAEVRWLDQKDTPTGLPGRRSPRRDLQPHPADGGRPLSRRDRRPHAHWARTAPANSFVADHLHLTTSGRQAFGRIIGGAVDQAAAERVAS